MDDFNYKNYFENFLEIIDEDDLTKFMYFSRELTRITSNRMIPYILENYQKLTLEDWNDNYFTIKPHIGQEVMRFGYKKVKRNNPNSIRSNRLLNKVRSRINEHSNIITSITFKLDKGDGDFSVNFNNGYWCFIHGYEIEQYYKVIKRKLKNI